MSMPTLDDVNLEGRQSKLGCGFVRLTPCGLAVDSLPTHPHSGRFINPGHVALAFRLMRWDDSPCSSLETLFGFTMVT
jgi:hypothetical protein